MMMHRAEADGHSSALLLEKYSKDFLRASLKLSSFIKKFVA